MKQLFLGICLLLVVAANTFSQTPPDIQSLTGLSGAFIGFQKYPAELEQDGLTSKQIATEVELRLRKAGIKILTADEVMKSPGSPVFEVDMRAIKFEEGSYAISIRLSLKQKVVTERKPFIGIVSATWEVQNLLTVGRANLRQVKDEVGDGVDVFANDFLTANPKPK